RDEPTCARRRLTDRAAGRADLRGAGRSLHRQGLRRPHRGRRPVGRRHGLQDRPGPVGQTDQGGLRAPADPDRRHPGRRRLQGHERPRPARGADLRPRRRPQEGGRGRRARGRPGGAGPVRRRAARPDGSRRRVRSAGDALPLVGRAAPDGQLQPLQSAGPRLGMARHRRGRGRRGGMNLPIRPEEALNPPTRAADPARSVFVPAHAGSGKTTTLVSRVARLLLGGAAPSAILCVTYTKAAAAEMQDRLFKTLGDWAVMDDLKLSAALAKLDDSDPAALNPARLSEARRLFARALETPGGLKIQTIHALCQKLLRRSPIEAGVSPRFTVLENEAAIALSHSAREDLARAALADAEGPIGEAYSHFAVELDWGRFQDLLALIENKRADLTDYVARVVDGRAPGPYVLTGADPQKAPEDIEADFLRWLDRGEVRRMAELMATGSKTDKDRAAELVHALDHDWSFHGLGVVFLTGSGSPRKSMATKQAPP